MFLICSLKRKSASSAMSTENLSDGKLAAERRDACRLDAVIDMRERAGSGDVLAGVTWWCLSDKDRKLGLHSPQDHQALIAEPAMHSLRNSLGFLLNRAGVAVGNAFSQELKMSGMTLAMWRVLAALHDIGNQNLSGLAELISVEISTLSRQVATLAARGLVVNQPSEREWRSVDISLTPAGRAVVQRLLPAVERHERAALDGIDAADVEQFKRLLEKIYGNLCTLDKVFPIVTGEDADAGPKAKAGPVSRGSDPRVTILASRS